MNVTPELIETAGKALVAVIAAVGAIITTVVTAAIGYYTWKTRYKLDQLYAATYRANEDGTPGPMRRHPKFLVNMFQAAPRDEQKPVVTTSADFKPSEPAEPK